MTGVRYSSRPWPAAACARLGVAVAACLACVGLSGVARAQTTKTFIDYIKPAPIVCSPLSSATWGVAGVRPRDICNGIESAKGADVPPEFYYWDGQVLKAKDGKYHMFMSTWSGTAGFNPGWTNSDAYHAVSDQGVLGPYQRQGYVYTNNGSHKGHNVSALELPDGSYAVVVSETVAFTIYKSSSLDGPWTGCTASIETNGVNAGTDTHFDSNVSLFPRHDGKFQIVQRHGLIAIADTLCGPYKMQKPTWTYPTENRPTIDSIYPRRTSIPGVSNPTFAWEEDPHLWRSGGIYHVLYSGSGDRVGWHLYSPDGINDWTDGGLSCNPRLYDKIFGYEGSTEHTQWYKMERPGVVLEDGHPTHVTWAVSDVDKDNQIPGNSNHGSKVIVLPFDGVTFDTDYGVGGGGAGAGGTAGAGAGGAGAGASSGGASGSGGNGGTGGAAGSGGSSGTGAAAGSGGQGGGVDTGGRSGDAGGAAVSGGAGGAGGAGTGGVSTNAGGHAGSGGAAAEASGGRSSGGATSNLGGAGAAAAGRGGEESGSAGTATSPMADGASSSGCACTIQGAERASGRAWLLLLGLVLLLVLRRRNSAKN
jgi:MYXO-CTERM domain-containing protein